MSKPQGNEGSFIMDYRELVALKTKTEERFKSGANWFYWIAALSIINSAIYFFKGSWNFIFGLGITQLIEGILIEFGSIGITIAIILNSIILGIFLLIGRLSNKRKRWAYIIGMVIYSLDSLVFLLAADIWSIGFHGFALFSMYGGLKAMKELEGLELEEEQYSEQLQQLENQDSLPEDEPQPVRPII
jgi:hypothetical protein